MANKKHQIQRICCACRTLQPVSQMARVVRVGETFVVQGTKRLSGRGAHVCPQCLSRPDLRKALNRSFRTQLPESVFNYLATIKKNDKLQYESN